MKIINSVVVVGLYYGFLTTFSIGPSYLFLLRAQVMEEGTEKKNRNIISIAITITIVGIVTVKTRKIRSRKPSKNLRILQRSKFEPSLWRVGCEEDDKSLTSIASTKEDVGFFY
ncbi:hypothetical chloroplast RF19 [Olea europaea subsp. europaea]|uniref:Protein TIC 214 n=1 Tax=Olea europaea subsp. europaea TaxID=158383 RepID=A0A8S0U5Q0_OLEEU|nr:hypothetical chloroplast RF19 [Olea europaea subsp. europaea]